MSKEKSLWLLSPLKVNDIIDDAGMFFFYEDYTLCILKGTMKSKKSF